MRDMKAKLWNVESRRTETQEYKDFYWIFNNGDRSRIQYKGLLMIKSGLTLYIKDLVN